MNELAWLLATWWGGYSPSSYPCFLYVPYQQRATTSSTVSFACPSSVVLSLPAGKTWTQPCGRGNIYVAGGKELGVILGKGYDTRRPSRGNLRPISQPFCERIFPSSGLEKTSFDDDLGISREKSCINRTDKD